MAHFYSRASREARLFRSAYRIWLHYFYSRASREARLIPTILSFSQNNISTHAPLARRDLNVMWEVEHEDYFYSRASREARPKASNAAAMQTDFYSRASREARRLSGSMGRLPLYFDSRASLEARLFNNSPVEFWRHFYLSLIHI